MISELRGRDFVLKSEFRRHMHKNRNRKPTYLSIFQLLLGFFISFAVHAQQKFTFSGYVKDSLSGENLIGASIAVNGKGKGVNSNGYGYFSITLPRDRYEITVSYAGYETLRFSLELDRDIQMNQVLPPKATTNEEVVVYADGKDRPEYQRSKVFTGAFW